MSFFSTLVFVGLFYSSSLFYSSISQALPERTLTQVLQQAIGTAEKVHVAEQDVARAHEQKKQAWASVAPQVSFKYKYFEQDVPASVQSTVADNQTTTYLNLEQTLFKGFADWAGLKSAQLQIRIKELALQTERLQLAEDVAKAFYSILLAQSEQQNALELQRILNERVIELQRRTRIGRTDRADLLSAQAQLARTKSDVLVQTTQLGNARRELNSLVPAVEPFVALHQSRKQSSNLQSVDDWLKSVDQRPDLQTQKVLVEQSEQTMQIEKAGHWPQLSLEGNYYFHRPPGSLVDGEWDLALTLKLPLFEGGGTVAKIQSAALAKAQAELSLAQKQRQVEQLVRSRFETLKQNLDSLELLDEAVRFSTTNYQTRNRQFKSGLVPYLEVIQTETEYWQITRERDRLLAEREKNELLLNLSVGRLP